MSLTSSFSSCKRKAQTPLMDGEMGPASLHGLPKWLHQGGTRDPGLDDFKSLSCALSTGLQGPGPQPSPPSPYLQAEWSHQLRGLSWVRGTRGRSQLLPIRYVHRGSTDNNAKHDIRGAYSPTGERNVTQLKHFRMPDSRGG